jgi:hypothetical protein
LGKAVSDAAGQGATADQSHSFAQVSPKP